MRKYSCCLTYLLPFSNSLVDLLQLNFENTHKWNKYALMKYANMFRVAWVGDRATMKRMPLLNILALDGEEPLIAISIFDCSDHMSEGDKKDATTIQEQSD